MKVDDIVTLDSTITKGLPVYYTVSWGDGTVDDVLHENGKVQKQNTETQLQEENLLKISLGD